MARTVRDAKLDTRSARLRLRANHEPYWASLAPGESLGYYRPASNGAGTWWGRVRHADRRYEKKALGQADDFAEADGQGVLSFAQAQAKAREWFGAARHGQGEEAPRRGPYTVTQAWEDYRQDCLRRGVKRVDRMECAANLYILPEMGAIEVERLAQGRIERWHQAIAEAPPRVKRKRFAEGPAFGARPINDEQRRKRRASANRILTILKSALNHAKQKRRVVCSADTWREVKPFGRADAPRLRYLKPEEQARLVNACPEDFRKLVKGALFSGARYGELIQLKARDFDAENGSLFIAESKSGRPRHLFLTDEGQAFFKEATAGLKAADLMFTREAFGDMRRVTPHTQAPLPKIQREWRTSDQKRPMETACRAAGIEPMGFHQLRHSYASALVNAGLPLAYVADQLGHSDTRMVERHYGHLAPSAIKEAIRKLAPRLGIHSSDGIEDLRVRFK